MSTFDELLDRLEHCVRWPNAGEVPPVKKALRAMCGKSASAMGPEVLCWCGFAHKHNHNATAYVCLPFTALETRPDLLAAFRACGCDPKRGGEVGIMLERDLRSEIHSA